MHKNPIKWSNNKSPKMKMLHSCQNRKLTKEKKTMRRKKKCREPQLYNLFCHRSVLKIARLSTTSGMRISTILVEKGFVKCFWCMNQFENHRYIETSNNRILQGNECKHQTYSKYQPHLITLISGLFWGVYSNALHVHALHTLIHKNNAQYIN